MRGIKCKNCNNYVKEWCDKVDDSPCPDLVRDCPYFWQITNADRIRAISDEELAKYLLSISTAECPRNWECRRFKTCEECWIDWLRQPAEE